MEHTTDDTWTGTSGRWVLSSEIIDRYLALECSDEERAVVERWRASAETPDAVIVDLSSLLKTYHAHNRTPPSPSTIEQRILSIVRNVDRSWQQEHPQMPHTRIAGPSDDPSRIGRASRWTIPHARVRTAWTYITASVAAVLVCASLLVIGWQQGRYALSTGITSQSSIYTTFNGERARITLPDGSQVMLNVASRLEVPANYATGNRNVRLDGEALFTVTHHTRTPFTVTAGPSVTKVLGTRFLVRHYPTDTAALVAVQDGKVAVQSHVLTAGQEAMVYAHQARVVQSGAPNRFTFANGILTLDGVRLQDAIPDLNRWFNADVRLGSPTLAGLRLGGEYAVGSVANLAEILELTFDVRVVRQGRILTLYPKG